MKGGLPITAEDVLRKARQIVQRGWTQGTYARDGRGGEVSYRASQAVSLCARGAILKVVQALSVDGAAECEAEDRLRSAFGGPWCEIATWNDAPERTQEEVLRAFDRAAGGK